MDDVAYQGLAQDDDGVLPKPHRHHTAAPSSRPWHIPKRVVNFVLCSLGVLISYADRSNMAVSIVAIAEDYGYTKSEQGLILSSFFFGYILTQIAGGALADRFGGKPVLTIGAASWTFFTLLTPLAARWGLGWLIALRIGLGLGEGVAFPSIHSMLGAWIPSCERSKAVALVTACSYMGAVIALPTSSTLVASSWRWPSVFYLFGAIGVVWSIAWQIWGASTPQECRGITAQELEWIEHQQYLDKLEGAAKKNSPRSPDQSRGTRRGKHVRRRPKRQQQPQQGPLSPSDLEVVSTDLKHGGNGSLRRVVLSPSGDTRVGSSTSSSLTQQQPPNNGDVFETNEEVEGSRSSMSSASSSESELEDVYHDQEANNVSPRKRNIFCYPQTWAIIISQFCSAWGFFIMQSWLPQYYLDNFGVDISKIGYFAVVPSIIQGVSGVTVGYFGDRAIVHWGWSSIKVRRWAQTIGAVGIGLFLMISGKWASTAWQAMFLISVGMALNGFTMIGATAYQHDICPHRAGLLFALGNTAATIPGIVGVALVGLILDQHGTNRWDLIWTGAFMFYCLGSVSFLALSSPKRIPK